VSEDVLETIARRVRERLEERKKKLPPGRLAREADGAPPPRDFQAPLRRPTLNVIAEFKPASPSEGPIRPAASVETIAREFEAAGAAALSVVTEPDFFGSSLEHLARARCACSLPILRKDFIFDPYQVDEARLLGADAVLLIVSLVDRVQLLDLLAAARRRGIEPLVEVHDEAELDRALEAGAAVVGVNQRDLRSLAVDRGRALRLLPRIPPDRLVVAESGLEGKADLEALRRAGCHGFLVGTALMRARSPGAALRELLS
jgi:indole-3-glycerol phosphate synthase